jgi:hypothetical protein
MTYAIPNQYFDTIVGNGKYSSPSKPLTSMTFGEYMAYAPQLIEATRGKKELGLEGTGKGTSASGAYQFTAETTKDIAPMVLGENWQSQKMTPENQRLMASKLFDIRKGGNLKNTWASLPNAEKGAYANMTFDEVEPIIVRGEVGYTGDSKPITAVANNTAPSNEYMDMYKDMSDRLDRREALLDERYKQSIADRKYTNSLASMEPVVQAPAMQEEQAEPITRLALPSYNPQPLDLSVAKPYVPNRLAKSRLGKLLLQGSAG